MTDYLSQYDQAVRRKCYTTLKNGKVVNTGDLLRTLQTMTSASVRDTMGLGSLGRSPDQLLELIAMKVPEVEYEIPSRSSSATILVPRFSFIPVPGFSLIGSDVGSDVETGSDYGPDPETLAEILRENPQTAAYLRSVEQGTPLGMPPSRPTGMPIPERVTPNPLVSREGQTMGMLSPDLVRNLEATGQYLYTTV